MWRIRAIFLGALREAVYYQSMHATFAARLNIIIQKAEKELPFSLALSPFQSLEDTGMSPSVLVNRGRILRRNAMKTIHPFSINHHRKILSYKDNMPNFIP